MAGHENRPDFVVLPDKLYLAATRLRRYRKACCFLDTVPRDVQARAARRIDLSAWRAPRIQIDTSLSPGEVLKGPPRPRSARLDALTSSSSLIQVQVHQPRLGHIAPQKPDPPETSSITGKSQARTLESDPTARRVSCYRDVCCHAYETQSCSSPGGEAADPSTTSPAGPARARRLQMSKPIWG
jgi:hypothetical protein